MDKVAFRRKVNELAEVLGDNTADPNTCYPLVSEGEHGWDFTLLVNRKGQPRYLVCRLLLEKKKRRRKLYSLRAKTFVDWPVGRSREHWQVNGKEYAEVDYISLRSWKSHS